MKLAIPILNNKVAPCFDTAKEFQIINIKSGKMRSSSTVKCHAKDGFMRIRLLRLNEVNTLICNGIKSFYRDQLLILGMNVIPNINNTKTEVLTQFLQGKLKSYVNENSVSDSINLVSHDHLVSWAKELFESKTYSVSAYPGEDSFLIDLVAKIKCPACGKMISVAICCGAQTYRTDQEIREFYLTAKSQFDSKVYVYLKNPLIEKRCDEYGINFISPEDDFRRDYSLLPLLSKSIKGHEKEFSGKNK